MTRSTDPKTILVVDDCAGVGQLIHTLLSRVGCHLILNATNGHEALRLARGTREIDLLLCNFDLCGLRGEEVAACFDVLHPSAPVVFLSNFATPSGATDAREVLAKPFTIFEFRETVRRALRRRSATPVLCAA